MGRERHLVWAHFERVGDHRNALDKGSCRYCAHRLSAQPQRLVAHLASCPRAPPATRAEFSAIAMATRRSHHRNISLTLAHGGLAGRIRSIKGRSPRSQTQTAARTTTIAAGLTLPTQVLSTSSTAEPALKEEEEDKPPLKEDTLADAAEFVSLAASMSPTLDPASGIDSHLLSDLTREFNEQRRGPRLFGCNVSYIMTVTAELL